jgi:hypothetical protein
VETLSLSISLLQWIVGREAKIIFFVLCAVKQGTGNSECRKYSTGNTGMLTLRILSVPVCYLVNCLKVKKTLEFKFKHLKMFFF